MAAFGLRPEDYAEEVLEIWPECHQAFLIFQRMTTQWRVGGMGGPTGLDYNVLFALTERLGLSTEDRDQLEEDVMVMESEVLTIFAEEAARRRAK